jgi:hypothetical protein
VSKSSSLFARRYPPGVALVSSGEDQMTTTSRLAFALAVCFAAAAGSAWGQSQKFDGGPMLYPEGYPGGYPGDGQGGGFFNSDGLGFGNGVSTMHVPLPGTLSLSGHGAFGGLGYEGSYASLHGTVPVWTDPMHGWWLIDARASVSHNGLPFTNVGIIRRNYFAPMCADIGVGVFYDFDGDKYENFGHQFHQVGVSGHVWTQYVDLNINGYMPIGETSHIVTAPFYQNLLVIQGGYDIALEGFDADVTLRPNFLAQHSGQFRIGGYAYDGDAIEAFGGFLFNFEFQPTAGLTLGATLTTDDQFDTAGLLSIAWNWGSSRGYSPTGRDLDPIRRNAHIVRAHEDPVYATNPDTGTFYRVVHVDNSAGNNGDGTFGNPYNELADADGTIGGDSNWGDIIFVHTGLSTDVLGNPANLTGYDTGIALLPFQRLLGDGVEHTVPTQIGDFSFSQFEDGLVPSITNFGGNVVTLANFNTVSGFNIQGFASANSGIIDNGAGAIDTIIDDVIIQGFSAPGGFGVNINPSVNTTITDSIINGNDTNIFLGP